MALTCLSSRAGSTTSLRPPGRGGGGESYAMVRGGGSGALGRSRRRPRTTVTLADGLIRPQRVAAMAAEALRCSPSRDARGSRAARLMRGGHPTATTLGRGLQRLGELAFELLATVLYGCQSMTEARVCSFARPFPRTARPGASTLACAAPRAGAAAEHEAFRYLKAPACREVVVSSTILATPTRSTPTTRRSSATRAPCCCGRAGGLLRRARRDRGGARAVACWSPCASRLPRWSRGRHALARRADAARRVWLPHECGRHRRPGDCFSGVEICSTCPTTTGPAR